MGQHKKPSELWSATQFLGSLEPCRMREKQDSNAAVSNLILHAHVIAVMNGEGWNQNNRYTLGVWVTAYQS